MPVPGQRLAKQTAVAFVNTMADQVPDIIAQTPQPRYPNGERKLSRDPFTQATWGLLALAAMGQLLLLVWLDVMS